jgi:hypothetical protein
VIRISTEGEIIATVPGELKGGDGLGHLWVNDPGTDLISSLSESGQLGDMVIPTERGLETMRIGIARLRRRTASSAGYDHPGDQPQRLRPESASSERLLVSLSGLDLIEFDGHLWDLEHRPSRSGSTRQLEEQHRYPMPGKPGGLAVADGALG